MRLLVDCQEQGKVQIEYNGEYQRQSPSLVTMFDGLFAHRIVMARERA